MPNAFFSLGLAEVEDVVLDQGLARELHELVVPLGRIGGPAAQKNRVKMCPGNRKMSSNYLLAMRISSTSLSL